MKDWEKLLVCGKIIEEAIDEFFLVDLEQGREVFKSVATFLRPASRSSWSSCTALTLA